MVRCAVSWKELGPQSRGLSLLVGGPLGTPVPQVSHPRRMAWGVASAGRGAFGVPRSSGRIPGLCREWPRGSVSEPSAWMAAHTRLHLAVPLCKGAPVLLMHVCARRCARVFGCTPACKALRECVVVREHCASDVRPQPMRSSRRNPFYGSSLVKTERALPRQHSVVVAIAHPWVRDLVHRYYSTFGSRLSSSS